MAKVIKPKDTSKPMSPDSFVTPTPLTLGAQQSLPTNDSVLLTSGAIGSTLSAKPEQVNLQQIEGVSTAASPATLAASTKNQNGSTSPWDSISTAMSGDKGATAFLSGVAGLATAAGNYLTEQMKGQQAMDRQVAGNQQVAQLQQDAINADISRRSTRGVEAGSNSSGGILSSTVKHVSAA